MVTPFFQNSKLIRNKINGKLFIGIAKNLKGILNSHKFQLTIGRHFNKELQQDYNKYGEANFDFEIIDYLKPKQEPRYDYTEDLNILEDMWLERIQAYNDKGYNSRKIKLNPLTRA